MDSNLKRIHGPGFIALLGFCVMVALMLPGCAGTDPFVIQSLHTIRENQVKIMDDRDAEAVKAGDKPLPQSFREDMTGAIDDLELYLKGERPKKDDK